MKNSTEYTELTKILGESYKSPKQINKLFESDCEILKLSDTSFLTTSIDSMSEEIDLGLYKQIETWAWMCVMSSVSDLCASGSTPLGLTLSAQWKHGTELDMRELFFKGINLACASADVALLGGNTVHGLSHVFTTSIIGESNTMPLMRKSIVAGDLLVLSHKQLTGIGPALAYRFLLNAEDEVLPENLFRPNPSWKESKAIAPLARAAIDTSDGIVTSVHTLTELNNLGVDLLWVPEINHPKAAAAMKSLGLL